MASNVTAVSPSPNAFGNWQKTKEFLSQGAKLSGRFMLKEAKLLGASALCGYLGTKVLGELPVNAVSKVLNLVNLANREGWIYLNAPEMAVYTTATVPVLQITNKIFGPQLPPGQSSTDYFFGPLEAIRMASAAFMNYGFLKSLETVANIISTAKNIFTLGNADALWPATALGMGCAYAVWDGLNEETTEAETDLVAQKQVKEADLLPEEKKLSRFAKFEVIAGTTGLGLLTLRSLYKYLTIPEPSQPVLPERFTREWINNCWEWVLSGFNELPVPEPQPVNRWSWTYWDAPGTASRLAVSLPIRHVVHQIFDRLLQNEKIPEPVRKLLQISTQAVVVGSSVYIAGKIGLPGANLDNPIETMKSIFTTLVIFYGLEQGTKFIIEKAFPEEEEMIMDPSMLAVRPGIAARKFALVQPMKLTSRQVTIFKRYRL